MVSDYSIKRAIKIIQKYDEQCSSCVDCLYDIKNSKGKRIFSSRKNAEKFMKKSWDTCHQNRNNHFY